MKVAGVITEYNPFHNGHKYQLEQIKRQTSADYIVVVMSGDFVQRGEPAIIDKYERTRMALLSGADLVLELPAVFATASAEFFAGGGVSVLKNTGVVDMLCYGVESVDHDNSSLNIINKQTSFFENINLLFRGYGSICIPDSHK